MRLLLCYSWLSSGPLNRRDRRDRNVIAVIGTPASRICVYFFVTPGCQLARIGRLEMDYFPGNMAIFVLDSPKQRCDYHSCQKCQKCSKTRL